MLCAATLIIASVFGGGPDDVAWPSFRGPNATGTSGDAKTAATWNLESGINVAWRTKIPGLAHSSPVIAGDRLFVTTAVRAEGEAPLEVGLYGSISPVDDDTEHAFKVYCLDRMTGDIKWEKTAVTAVPKIKRHPKGSHAASSPATNGEVVVAFFASEGLYCYDMDGNLQWSRQFGVLDSGYFVMKDAQWGFASSPIIHADRVIVQCDVQEGSFLAALDIKTGLDVWRTERRDVPTWSTPTVDIRDGRRQIICNGWKHMGGYDLDTGDELWSLDGGGDIPVPTPIVAHDLIYLTNAHGRVAPIVAVDPHATGKLTLDAENEHIAWLHPRKGNYMQTPIVHEDLLYLCNDAGVITCYDAVSGEKIYSTRLGSGRTGFTASPIVADGKLYYTSETGEVHVLRAGRKSGDEAVSIAVNDMGVECMATPAMAGGMLYWRTRNEVVAIGEPPDGD